mmetsp:Transcript_2959/g.10710  ORF Transcript_2959/g.10710 Transcript_2959/m.10710 type:complete len:609 (-) Transcript_2959:822-2648(-)
MLKFIVIKSLAPSLYKLLLLGHLLVYEPLANVVARKRFRQRNASDLFTGLMSCRRAMRRVTGENFLKLHIFNLCFRCTLPGAYRTLKFYKFLLRLSCGYGKTMFWDTRHINCEIQLNSKWAHRHTWGAKLTKSAILELSGFYLKVAQVIASKADMLPRQYVEELSCVLDDCPPMPMSRVKRFVEEDLNTPLHCIFREFSENPIGSATIAQVHSAVTCSGQYVAVKIQNIQNKKIMRFDVLNMLFVSRLLDRLQVFLPFDHTNILLEYSAQVPLEFDFQRERQMLSVLGASLHENFPNIIVPEPVDYLCTSRILTMRLIKGCPLSNFVNIDIGNSTWSAAPHNLEELLSILLTSFGFQILEIGAFHSDPHPGNVMISDSGDLALIDFGQVKILSEHTRLLLAHLVISLYEGTNNFSNILNLLRVELSTDDLELQRTIAHILFDTRMDIPEALLSPFDPDFPKELVGVRICNIPTDVFMVIRVIAIFRGVFAAFRMDIHARKLWIDIARRSAKSSHLASHVKEMKRNKSELTELVEKLKMLNTWLRLNNLPCDRKQMFCFARANILSVEDIDAAVKLNKNHALEVAFAYFDNSEKHRCLELVLMNRAVRI